MALAYDPEENAGSESDSSRWAQGTAPSTSDWLVLSLVSLLYRDPGPGRAYLTDPGPIPMSRTAVAYPGIASQI